VGVFAVGLRGRLVVRRGGRIAVGNRGGLRWRPPPSGPWRRPRRRRLWRLLRASAGGAVARDRGGRGSGLRGVGGGFGGGVGALRLGVGDDLGRFGQGGHVLRWPRWLLGVALMAADAVASSLSQGCLGRLAIWVSRTLWAATAVAIASRERRGTQRRPVCSAATSWYPRADTAGR
jgi:hypothetical protein